MNKRLFVTLSMAGLAMVAFGARKPKAAIKSSVKTVAIKQLLSQSGTTSK